MSSPVNQSRIDQNASYNPESLGGQVCATETIKAVVADEKTKLASNPDSSLSKLPYIFGLLASPRFSSPSALKNIESLLASSGRVARPAASAVETVGKTSAGLWSSIGTLFGAALGGFSAGPATELASMSKPQSLDFASDKLQGLGLKPEEIFILTREVLEHPERRGMLNEALARPTLKERRDELRAMIRIILPPGQTLQIEDEKGNVIARYANERSSDRSPRPPEVVQKELARNIGPCPSDMVLVPAGNYKNKSYPAICVDKNEYTDTPDRLPLTNQSWQTAERLCVTKDKRLPSADEWARVASANGTLEFSTRTGEFDYKNAAGLYAIHHNATDPRAVCMAEGAYITYSGKEICDLNGNVHEWTSDHLIVGGAYTALNEKHLHANYRRSNSDYGNLLVGFRCVSSPRAGK